MYRATFISAILGLSLFDASSFVTSPRNDVNKINTSFLTNGVAQKYSFTALAAIGVFARKAKEAEIKKYIESGNISPEVESKLSEINSSTNPTTPNKLQNALTKRKGTITIIAEYKRALEKGGFVDDIFGPEVLSPTFREFGASAVAILADERMGGCSYSDIKIFKEEQETSRGSVPGPIPVISNDLIVDDIQLALSAVNGADAVTVRMNIVGAEKAANLMNNARSIGLDVIINVATKEEAQLAIDFGGRILCVPGMATPEDAIAIVDGLNIPKGEKVCTIATIVSKSDEGLGEIEEAWVMRDKGFNAVWVSDCLYKSGNDPTEHAGAIIRSMGQKSSVKYASAKAKAGKGEGAREYLGDLLM